MKIISFAWTTPALIAREKTVTRREWSEPYARSFKPGELVQAWDKLPRAGGKRVGTIRIESVTYSNDYPHHDYSLEGLSWMQAKGMKIRGMDPAAFWLSWREIEAWMWVVRFQVVDMDHDEGEPCRE